MNKILSETNKEREKSCGCIIINKNKVLLIKQTKGHWGFPKGHVEKYVQMTLDDWVQMKQKLKLQLEK